MVLTRWLLQTSMSTEMETKICFQPRRLKCFAPEARLAGSLTLHGFDVVGASSARVDPAGTPGLRVEGDFTSLSLSNMSLPSCAPYANPSVQYSNEGSGGALFAGSGATVDIRHSSFLSNTATGPGGSIAVWGSSTSFSAHHVLIADSSSPSNGGGLSLLAGASAHLSSVSVDANVASGSGGGGIFVDHLSSLTASDALVVQYNVVPQTSIMFGVGGGLLAADGASIDFGANVTRFVSNTASWGGGLGLVQTQSLGTISSVGLTIDLPVFDTIPAPRIAATDLVMEGNRALRGGGALFGCGASISLSGPLTSFHDNTVPFPLRDQSLFTCGQTSTPVPYPWASEADPLWVSFDSLAWNAPAGGSSLTRGGPLASLEWNTAPDASIMSGILLTGSLRGRDVYQQTVAEEDQALEFTFAGPDRDKLLKSGATLAFLTSAIGVDVPATRLVVRNAFSGDIPLQATYALGPRPRDDGTVGFPVATLEGSVTVQGCRSGYGGALTVEEGGAGVVCTECVEGTASLVADMTPCFKIRECLAGSIPVGDESASSNNATTTSPVVDPSSSSSSVGQSCICGTGFTLTGYDVDPESNTLPICSPCPTGAVCPPGLDPPLPRAGFYETSNGTFNRCLRESACPGGSRTSQCAFGYEGYLCNKCIRGYFSTSSGDCDKCSSQAANIMILGFVGLGIAALCGATYIGLGVLRVHAKAVASGSGNVRLRTRLVPASIGMSVVACQVLGILADAKVSWSTQARTILDGFNVFNFDATLFATECSLSTFHLKYAVSVGVPAAILVATFFLLVVFRAFRWRPLLHSDVKTLLDASIFVLCPILYIPMARSTLVLFDCVQLPNNDFVLDADPSILCFDGSWWAVFPVGASAFALFVVGVPVYFVYCLYTHRGVLKEGRTIVRYGALYRLFRLSYFWAGVLDLGKRLFVVMAAAFASEHQLALLIMLLVTFGAWCWVVARHEVYFYPTYNALDLRISCVLLLMVVIAFASYAERSNPSSESSITGILVGGLLLFLIVAIHGVVKDVKEILQTKRSRYSPFAHRSELLARHLSHELRDVDRPAGVDPDDSLVGVLLPTIDALTVYVGESELTTTNKVGILRAEASDSSDLDSLPTERASEASE